MIEQKKDYELVDLLKFLFCLGIIAIHSSVAPSHFLLRAIFRLGVPFFFVTSGFFLGKKVLAVEKSNIWPVIKLYCGRLLKPFLVFSAITVIENLITGLLNGQAFFEILLVQAEYLLVYPRGALWYLSACIVGALLLIPFLRIKKLNLALLLGSGLYSFALLCNNYYFLVENTRFEYFIQKYLNYFESARNGVFVGFFFLAIGIKCAELFFGKEDKIKKRWVYPSFLVALCFYFAEAYFVNRLAAGAYREDGGYFISQIIVVPLLLLAALKTEFHLPRKLSRTLRDCSVGMYLMHAPLLWMIRWAKLPNLSNYGIVVATCLLICLIVYRFKKEPFYSLLR